jgi:hypothetical protein
MRTSAGADAAMICEFAAEEDRIVREVRTRNRFAVKSKQHIRAAFDAGRRFLKKDQAEQGNDRDPRDRICHNDAVP